MEFNLPKIIEVLTRYGYDKCLKVYKMVREDGEGSISAFDTVIGEDVGDASSYYNSAHMGDYMVDAVDYIRVNELMPELQNG